MLWTMWRAFAFMVSALLIGCDSEVHNAGDPPWDSFTLHYELRETANFPGELPIVGIDWDGTRPWIAYREQLGTYYDNDRVTLVQYDQLGGQRLHSFEYNDEYMAVNGLAWTGSTIWLNYGAPGDDLSLIKELDPNTGEVIRTFAGENGVHDLEFDGEHMLLSNIWDHIQVMDVGTAALLSTMTTSAFEPSTQRGIAYRDGEIWLVSQFHNQLAILDPQGKQIGFADTNLLDPGNNYASDLYLAFAGDQLAIVKESRIYLLDIVPAP
jgi:hypothetical protein